MAVTRSARRASMEEKRSNGESYLSRLRRSFTFHHISADEHFNFIVSLAWILVPICLLCESISPTAYGRFGDQINPKLAMDPRLGWFLMELPVTVVFIYFFYIKKDNENLKTTKGSSSMRHLMAAIFLCQYLYRGFFFPFQMKPSSGAKNFSMVTVMGGATVTAMNGYITAKWLRYFSPNLESHWIRDPRFIIGIPIYYAGLCMLVVHDSILRNLRNTPGPRYRVPHEGMFQFLTCPQYFAELITWTGFALMTWGPPGVFMILVTLSNLPLRAQTTHEWYIAKFGDEFPAHERNYMIPYIW